MPRKAYFDFNTLIFTPTGKRNETKASISFPNQYGANIYCHSSNTNRELPYEFELTYRGERTVHPSICDDNIGYLSKDDICSLIIEAQHL